MTAGAVTLRVRRLIRAEKTSDRVETGMGRQACPHPAFAKEYDLGERTGNYVCTQCGTTFTFKERAELLASRGGAANA